MIQFLLHSLTNYELNCCNLSHQPDAVSTTILSRPLHTGHFTSIPERTISKSTTPFKIVVRFKTDYSNCIDIPAKRQV